MMVSDMASNITLSAARELADRASRYEKKAEKEKMASKHTTQSLVFVGTNIVASPALGYLVGRLDSRDGVIGDGIKVLGMPIVGLAGAVVAGVGVAVGGNMGAAVAGLGTSAVNAEMVILGLKHGAKAAAEAAAKAAAEGK